MWFPTRVSDFLGPDSPAAPVPDPVGDRVWLEGFDALSRKLRPKLIRFFLRRAASTSDAEEMVQELFLRLLRRPDLFSLQNIEGYVFEAAANLARDRVRRDQTRGGGLHVDIAGLEAGTDEPSAEQVVDGRQRLARMIKALDALPPRARTIVILRRFEDLTHGQIAERLGISVSAVEKHMVRSMSALRSALGKTPI